MGPGIRTGFARRVLIGLTKKRSTGKFEYDHGRYLVKAKHPNANGRLRRSYSQRHIVPFCRAYFSSTIVRPGNLAMKSSGANMRWALKQVELADAVGTAT